MDKRTVSLFFKNGELSLKPAASRLFVGRITPYRASQRRPTIPRAGGTDSYVAPGGVTARTGNPSTEASMKQTKKPAKSKGGKGKGGKR